MKRSALVLFVILLAMVLGGCQPAAPKPTGMLQ